MKKNRIIKLTIFIFFMMALVVLIKYNVTATKENYRIKNSSVISLQIHSDTVQDVYSKLIFLEDDFIKDDRLRNYYFKINDDKKFISNEEKLYTVFNSLYKKNAMKLKENRDGTITLSIDEENVKNEIEALFIDASFEFIEADYSSSLGCGIESLTRKDGVYEFIIKKCIEVNEISKNELISAEKDGNFINLKIRSFVALREKNKKGKYTDNYLIKNYNEDELLDKVTLDEINEYTDKIFKEIDIAEYIFSFKLKDDNYYLTSVQKA